MKTDEEIKNLAGHIDAIPKQFGEWFLKGFRTCENEQQIKKPTIVNNTICKCIELIQTTAGWQCKKCLKIYLITGIK